MRRRRFLWPLGSAADQQAVAFESRIAATATAGGVIDDRPVDQGQPQVGRVRKAAHQIKFVDLCEMVAIGRQGRRAGLGSRMRMPASMPGAPADRKTVSEIPLGASRLLSKSYCFSIRCTSIV